MINDSQAMKYQEKPQKKIMPFLQRRWRSAPSDLALKFIDIMLVAVPHRNPAGFATVESSGRTVDFWAHGKPGIAWVLELLSHVGNRGSQDWWFIAEIKMVIWGMVYCWVYHIIAKGCSFVWNPKKKQFRFKLRDVKTLHENDRFRERFSAFREHPSF